MADALNVLLAQTAGKPLDIARPGCSALACGPGGRTS